MLWLISSTLYWIHWFYVVASFRVHSRNTKGFRVCECSSLSSSYLKSYPSFRSINPRALSSTLANRDDYFANNPGKSIIILHSTAKLSYWFAFFYNQYRQPFIRSSQIQSAPLEVQGQGNDNFLSSMGTNMSNKYWWA